MLRDPDLDVRMAAIWSLSQIGGKGVSPALEKQLKTTEDDAEAEQVENALENLDFTEDLLHISLLDITDVEDEEDEIFSDDELDDLEDEGDSPA
jgi:HEAT repeat protein